MKKFYLLLAAALPLMASAKWGPDPQEALPPGTNQYLDDYVMGPDGSVWNIIMHPDLSGADDEYDTQRVVYQYWIQRYDSDGVKQFDEGDYGMLLSQERNISFTMFNRLMFADSDGNLVVAVSDMRNAVEGGIGFTAYKISPEGEMLWDEEGIALDGGRVADTVAGMDITELDDGSYIFAWMKSAGNSMTIQLQRLANDGTVLWEPGEVSFADGNNMYPYLVNAGDNQFIMVYCKGSGGVLTACKIDFDGTPVWSNEVTIYSGGWGSIPPWTKISVVSSGDGGVLVAWNDDRAFTNIESAFISYVTGDGRLGFAGASPLGEVKVGYGGWKCFNCSAIPANDGEGFLAVWRETDSSQAFQQIAAQRISKSGELLWDENGVIVTENINDIFDEGYVSYSAISIRPGEEGQSAIFYMMRDDRTYPSITYSARYTVLSNETGTMWDKGTVTIDSRNSGDITGLQTLVSEKEGFWVARWIQEVPTENEYGDIFWEPYYYIQRFNFDGTTCAGQSGIGSATSAASGLSFSNGLLVLSGEGDATVRVYDVAGNLISVPFSGALGGTAEISLGSLPGGVYIVKIEYQDRNVTGKIIIR